MRYITKNQGLNEGILLSPLATLLVRTNEMIKEIGINLLFSSAAEKLYIYSYLPRSTACN
jgi:hypothetical protein